MAEEVNPVQQAIRQMNDEASGIQPSNPDPQQQVTPQTPAPQTPPAAQHPIQQPATPKTAPIVAPDQPEYKIPEPAFIKPQDQPAAATETPAAEQTPAAATTDPDEFVYSRLSDMTGGAIKDSDSLVGLIHAYNELVEEAEKGFEPKFADERAKWAYQLLTQNVGSEPEAAMRTLRALNFKPEGKDAKDVLFEAYLLDPKNSDQSLTKAQQDFRDDFDEKYNLVGADETELTPEQLRSKRIQTRNLELSVGEAKGKFSQVQNEFKATEPVAAKPDENVLKRISSAVQEYQGVRVAFTDNPQEMDYLNIGIEDPSELQQIQNDILNPNEWYQNFLQQFDLTSQQGFNEMVQEFHLMKNHHQNRQLAYDHGYKMGQIATLNTARNASTPKEVAQVATPAAVPQKSFMQAWESAQAGR